MYMVDLWWLIAYLARVLGEKLEKVHVWACQRWCRKHFGVDYDPDPEICFSGFVRLERRVFSGKVNRLADKIGVWVVEDLEEGEGEEGGCA